MEQVKEILIGLGPWFFGILDPDQVILSLCSNGLYEQINNLLCWAIR